MVGCRARTKTASTRSTSSSTTGELGVAFYDWGTWGRAVSQIQSHAGWTDQGGSNQTFVDHGNCYDMIAQAADGGTLSTRNHIRLHPIHEDPVYGWTTVGDAHHEDYIWYCGHAVDANGSNGSGFDQGRRNLRVSMENGGHPW